MWVSPLRAKRRAMIANPMSDPGTGPVSPPEAPDKTAGVSRSPVLLSAST